MLANGLKLNHDKTELTCIQSRFLSRPPLDEIVVCDETIVPCISSVNLDVVCKSSYFHSRNRLLLGNILLLMLLTLLFILSFLPDLITVMLFIMG